LASNFPPWFFAAGPLLKLCFANPCVLLIDELDKVDHALRRRSWRSSPCGSFHPRLERFRHPRFRHLLTSNEERSWGIPAASQLCIRTNPTAEREGNPLPATPEPAKHASANCGLCEALRASASKSRVGLRDITLPLLVHLGRRVPAAPIYCALLAKPNVTASPAIAGWIRSVHRQDYAEACPAKKWNPCRTRSATGSRR